MNVWNTGRPFSEDTDSMSDIFQPTFSRSTSVICAVSLLSSSAILAESTWPSLPGTDSDGYERPARVSLTHSLIMITQATYLQQARYLPVQPRLFSTCPAFPSEAGGFLLTVTAPDSSEPPAPASESNSTSEKQPMWEWINEKAKRFSSDGRPCETRNTPDVAKVFNEADFFFFFFFTWGGSLSKVQIYSMLFLGYWW